MHKNRSSSILLRELSREKHYTLSERKNCETTSAQSEDQSRSSQKKYKYSLFRVCVSCFHRNYPRLPSALHTVY